MFMHKLGVSLSDVLVFFTGADSIPPTGYETATLNLNDTNHFPTASTCAVQLTLPTKYHDYNDFKSVMDTAMKMHGGFGLI